MEYKCLRCGYKATQKSNLINHLKRKKICLPIKQDISIENVQKYYGFETIPFDSKSIPFDSISIPFDSKTQKMDNLNSIPFDSKSIPFDSKMAKMDNPGTIPFDSISIPFDSKSIPFDSILSEKRKFQCPYCLKFYSTNSNLTKHQKLCKIKKEKDHDKQKIKELEKNKLELQEKVDKLLFESGNTINNTNNCNNNNTTNNSIYNSNSNNTINIHINNYGDENKDYITHNYLLQLLKTPFQAIPELIKFTHFNDEHPENQNIKIPNKKEPYVKIRKNDKWELADRKETITDLIDQKHSELNDSDLYSLINAKFKELELDRLERFNQKYMNDDKDFANQLYKNTELMILNNSKKKKKLIEESKSIK